MAPSPNSNDAAISLVSCRLFW